MLSPFPGMDPYLEAPSKWRGVHVDLISRLRSTLNGQLPQGYLAEIDERLYIVSPRRNIYPDITVLGQARGPRRRKLRGSAAVATESDPPFVILREFTEIREAFINIRRADEPGRVITTLEVLSPTNKDPNHPGRELYLEKQRQILESSIHLVEIDLLRRGSYTVAAPEEFLEERGPWHYVVSLHRGSDKEDRFETWPVTVRERLPRIRIPLAGEERDEVIELQAVLERCYGEAHYDRGINYREDPAIPLDADDALWADALLREKGLRPRRRSRRTGGRS